MAISRAQIPEQVDIFNEGGAAESNADSYTDLYDRLSQANYEDSYNKYLQRLSQFAPEQKKMSIYDVASELGAGLLSTPNTGMGSTFTGLGVGFGNISTRIKQAEKENEAMRRQIGLQAAEMAMQDEKSALDFLTEYEMKNIDYRNKRGDLLTFEYKNDAGEIIRTTVRDNYSNDDIIDDLIYVKGAVEAKAPGSVVNIAGQETSERDKEAIKRQFKQEEEIFTQRKAGVSSIANLNEAEAIAKRLGKENFGTVAKLTLYPRQLLSGFGLTSENQDQIIGDQILAGQISLGFTMDIVSRTKGAISNREMEMFERASPGLGSNYVGYLKQVDYLKRVAQRDIDAANAYATEADRLEKLEQQGELSASQVTRQLDLFMGDWYNDNLIFNKVVDGKFVKSNYSPEGSTKDEFGELSKIATGNHIDEEGNVYVTDEGLNADLWAKNYREGQDAASQQKSSYTMNKLPAIDALERKKESIQANAGLTPDQKKELIQKIDEKIQALQE